MGLKLATITESADTGKDHNKTNGETFLISRTYCISSTRIALTAPPPKQEEGLCYTRDVQNHVFSSRSQGDRISAAKGWLRYSVFRCHLMRETGRFGSASEKWKTRAIVGTG